MQSLVTTVEKVNETQIAIKEKKLKINFSNGDIFTGNGSGRYKFNKEGKYEWNEGYSYEGEFYLSRPFGEGVYTNCLGVERKGYFFRGYLLKDSYGLDQLKSVLKKKFTVFEDGDVSRLISDDLRFLTDPDVILGCQLFKEKIKFRLIFNEMEEWKKQFSKDLECIRDGELDYDDNWSDLTRNKIQIVMIREYFDEFKGKKLLIRRRESINEKQISLKESEMSVGLKKEEKISISKKFRWVSKADINDLTTFQTQEIIEMVKDQNFEGVRVVYKKFLKKKKIFKFLNLKDQKKRNLLMIAGNLGYRQLVIDLLTALKKCIKEENLTNKQIQKYFETKDYEGNNLVDLIMIRGFNVKEEETFSNKEPEEEWNEEIFEEIRNKIEIKEYSKNQKKNEKEEEEEKENSKCRKRNGNRIFNSAIKLIQDNERELFTSRFLTFLKLREVLEKNLDSFEGESAETDDIIFVSKRAVILFILFKFCKKIKNLEILKQKDYDEKRNNPLHFALFRADFHATVILLEHRIMMLLWRNGDQELPPQAIRWSGDNYYKSRAIFASILSEFTRNFNLRVIDNLLVQEEGVLNAQKKKLVYKVEGKINQGREKERVEKMKKSLKKNFFFNKEKVYLYSNNYLLLSDELCKQYLQLIRDKNRYRHLKKDHRILKNYTFVINSELESFQKNFLDYYQGTFVGYHPPDVEKFYRDSVQEILTWYVFVYGDAEIDPRIYSLMNIDPFERILDGRNIFHFMSENNSYSLMKDFLDYLYEKCHDRPFDETRDQYKKWDEDTLNPKKYENLKKNLMIRTKENRQTSGHLCIMNKNFECLELLVEFDIDLQAINLRGRTVKELLDSFQPYNLGSRSSVSPDDISTQIINYFKQDIINSCKQHSLKYKYIKEKRNEGFKDLMTKSKFGLNKDLTEVRDRVYEDSFKALKKFRESGEKITFYTMYLGQASEVLGVNQSAEEIIQICEDNISNLEKKNDGQKMDMFLGSIDLEDIKNMNLALVKMILGGHTSFINQKQILLHLFNYKTLGRLEKFKLTKYERVIKKELYKKIEELDLAKPLEKTLMNDFTMDQDFCIEVRIQKGDLIQDNVVLDQIENIKKKYSEHGGGLRIDLIKGYDIELSKKITWYKPWTFFTCWRKYKVHTWFILIKLTDSLLKHIATRDQMGTYNFKLDFHTLFYEDDINSDELEPLRHHQKIDIMMKLLQEEFDIKRYQKKGLVVKYFPIHDYSKKTLIKKIWSENKWEIHFKDTFNTKTKKSTLTVLSMITFYHGIQQGFYFSFLSLYNNNLFLLAFIGIIGIVLQYLIAIKEEQLVFGMSLLVGIWSTVFVNTWKRREKELAYSFDAFEEENIKQVRENYKGEAVIDRGLLNISKKSQNYRCRKFTTVLFTVGLLSTFGIYVMVTGLNKQIEENSDISGTLKTVLTFAVGTMNGTLNFILSLIYGYCVEILVIWENHMYHEEMRKSTILKQQIFKLTSTVFTLVVQSIFQSDEKFDYNNYTLQIFSNLLTSASLNYGLSLGLPFFSYLTSRFYYYSFIFLCKWCCCKERRGKLDEYRENIIYQMLSEEKTKHSFLRYCVKGEKISPELRKKIDKFLKKKRKDIKKNSKKNKVKPALPVTITERENETLLQNTQSEEEETHEEKFKKVFEKIENIEPHKSYKGKCEGFGQNRKRNISLRLKEEFMKFVLGREKIIETSYMLDLGKLEDSFYSSLLTQFTFICLFSQFLISAGLVSYIINLFIISMTIRAYTEITRRPISRRASGIGIWSKLFDVVGYLGIVYNAIITVKLQGGFRNFLSEDIIKEELKDVEYVYRVQFGLLIFKFILSIVIPTLPSWIEMRINRERLTRSRLSKKLSSTLSRLSKEMKKSPEENIFEDDESKNLKYFFKNEDEITQYVKLPRSYVNENSDGEFGGDVLFRVKKSDKNLL